MEIYETLCGGLQPVVIPEEATLLDCGGLQPILIPETEEETECTERS